MLDEIESKTVCNEGEEDRQRKGSKTLSEVKPVENISKNRQSFLQIIARIIESSRFISHRARV